MNDSDSDTDSVSQDILKEDITSLASSCGNVGRTKACQRLAHYASALTNPPGVFMYLNDSKVNNKVPIER